MKRCVKNKVYGRTDIKPSTHTAVMCSYIYRVISISGHSSQLELTFMLAHQH